MAGNAALGTELKYVDSGNVVGRLTSIGGVSMSAEHMDVTTHDSPGGFKEYIATLKEPGEVQIEGFMGPNDAGQVEMLAHFEAGDDRDMLITYPDGVGGEAGSTWAFTCSISSYEYGKADATGALEFSATLRITGMPEFTPVVSVN